MKVVILILTVIGFIVGLIDGVNHKLIRNKLIGYGFAIFMILVALLVGGVI